MMTFFNNWLFISLLLVAFNGKMELPAWFTKAFINQKHDLKYELIKGVNPTFITADFNGDGVDDIATQIIEKKSKKKGVIIIEGSKKECFIIGAGFKIGHEDFHDTNWAEVWKLYKNRFAYETTYDSEWNITGSRKVKIKYPGIELYDMMDGAPLSGILIYWNGKHFSIIHEGE